MEDPVKKESATDHEACKKQSNEYLNNWKRSAADFINYKKGEVERAGMLIGYAKENVFSNILPVIDSIYLASAAFGKEGFAPVEKQIQDFLKKEGIEVIETMGKEFNPNFHEIVEEVGPSEALAKEGESGMIVAEMQKGYKMGEKVLRPAKVKVSK